MKYNNFCRNKGLQVKTGQNYAPVGM